MRRASRLILGFGALSPHWVLPRRSVALLAAVLVAALRIRNGYLLPVSSLSPFDSLLYPVFVERLVLGVGLEPTCLAAHEPESCASANFATRAFAGLALLGKEGALLIPFFLGSSWTSEGNNTPDT